MHFFRRRSRVLVMQDWIQSRSWRRTHPFGDSPNTGDFFEGVTLLPHVPPSEIKAILNQPVVQQKPHRPDIVCFSIIDWSFRFQRPQQIMTRFIAHGHRVFYLNVSDFLPVYSTPRFSVRPIKQINGEQESDSAFEVKIASRYPLNLFGSVISGSDTNAILESLEELVRAHGINDAIAYVMFPSWSNVARAAQSRWGWSLVYDCMDEWENFPGIEPEALILEKQLARSADLIVASAERLYRKWRSFDRPIVLARNAADFLFYSERSVPNDLLDGVKHPIVGYFGAIAEWFNVELLARVASERPDYTFVLLGGVFNVDVMPLQELPNVILLGQQPYETMPQYLYHFDACIIPFRQNSITEATDPVKLYEYLSGGKPVVSVGLPELEPYRDFVHFADTPAEFAAELDKALREDGPAKANERKELARRHTWEDRYASIAAHLTSTMDRVSIVIITFNNLALTRLCLDSVIRTTQSANCEIIVVDNDSHDGTPEYLLELAAAEPRLKVILNPENVGFAKANNQGIAESTGEYLVLLNNDTVVPGGWLKQLLWHLRDDQIGIVGPLTNFVGNEARIEVTYHTCSEMEKFARSLARTNDRKIADIHMLAMFCVAMRRKVYDQVGPLDEDFGVGMFEDDDYSLRVRKAGLRVVCAADAFVHHFGQAAFGKLIESGEYNEIFEQNRRLFEAKWHTEWQPHKNATLKFKPHRVAEPATTSGARW